VVAALLLLVAVALRGRMLDHGNTSHDSDQQAHLVGFSLAREVAGGVDVFTASLTNQYGVPIFLRGHAIQYEDDRGKVTNGPRGWSTWHPWVGTTNFDTLLPGGVATISFPQNEVPGAARRIRLVFQYFYDAGPLTKAAVHAVTNLPVGSLSPEVRYRLYQQGLLNGQHQRSYDGDWVSNPQGGANGRQPLNSDTNRTSATAASRRSP
jgi:hypothetical protein